RLTGDLGDEDRELGSRIAEYENEQSRIARGGRLELDSPLGAPTDDRPFARPTREDMRRVFEAAEARLDDEIARAADSRPGEDPKGIRGGVRGVGAVVQDGGAAAAPETRGERTHRGKTKIHQRARS